MVVDRPSSATMVAIGIWTENTVRVYSSFTLTEVVKVSLQSNETQVRDAMVVTLGKVTYILLGECVHG